MIAPCLSWEERPECDAPPSAGPSRPCWPSSWPCCGSRAPSSIARTSCSREQEDGPAVPARYQAPNPPPRRVAVLGAEEEQDATKELKASRDSAQKASKDAREVQSKLSIEENVRKAEETRKVNAATTSWQRWVYGALACVVAGLIARAILRRNS